MQAARTLHWPNRSHSAPLLLKNSELKCIAFANFGWLWPLLIAAGGLLNATFGNATELVISIHALRSGKLRVVQQSLLGSILSNTLLVLGCAFFGGGLTCGKSEQIFRKVPVVLISSQVYMVQIDTEPLLHWQEDAVLNSGLLLMAVMGLVSPAMLYYTHTEVNLGKSALALSRFSSCIMLFAYAAFIFFELSNSRRRDESSEASRMSSFS